MISSASVHGRFQPFHSAHLEYLEEAFRRAEFLYVGITQFARMHLQHVDGAGEHRTDPRANPLTYFERMTIINEVLADAGYSADRYCVIPFPIEQPDELADYLPTSIPILTTRVDQWNDRKIELLEGLGYSVDVLYERDPKTHSGELIRDLLAAEDPMWSELVPPATARLLREWQVADRLD